MILNPFSFNGTSLSSTDYETTIPRASSNLQLTANPLYIKRGGAVPVYSGKDFQPAVLTLEVKCLHDFMTLFETVNQLFDVKDETPRQLICTDSEDSNKQYYVYATAKQVLGGHDGQMATVTLALDDPIWQSVTQNSRTFAVTGASDSTSVTNAGNDYAYPVLEITPASLPSTDYRYNIYVQVLPQSAYPYANRFLDIAGSTDTTFDTAALVAAGKMQADGDDLRVFRDGVEVDRWLNGMNTTDTHVIVACDMPAMAGYQGAAFQLGADIASTDTVTEIVLRSKLYATDWSALPMSGRLILDSALGSTDTEEFTYTNRYLNASGFPAFAIGARACRNTTAQSWTVSPVTNVRFMPYDFNIVFGNASATAPVTDDSRKPVQELTSRNWSFIYSTAFYNLSGTRPGIFQIRYNTINDPLRSTSGLYTSTNDAGDTDPATALGMRVQTYLDAGVWRTDSPRLVWALTIPDGINSVAAGGAQKQTSSSWPGISLRATFYTTGVQTLYSLAAQASTDYGTFTTWSVASTDLLVDISAGLATGLEWYLGGAVTGTSLQSAYAELSSLTIGIKNYPHVVLRTGGTGNTQINKLDFTLANAATGEALTIVYPLPQDETLIVDCSPDFPTAKHNGQIVNGAVSLSTIRAAWLRFAPGVNTLNLVNNLSATSSVNIVLKWYDRANFM